MKFFFSNGVKRFYLNFKTHKHKVTFKYYADNLVLITNDNI